MGYGCCLIVGFFVWYVGGWLVDVVVCVGFWFDWVVDVGVIVVLWCMCDGYGWMGCCLW